MLECRVRGFFCCGGGGRDELDESVPVELEDRDWTDMEEVWCWETDAVVCSPKSFGLSTAVSCVSM